MKLSDSLRQLYLLLWKNFTLRWRKKIRIVVEIAWPLFLFLILMWVRTRGLRSNISQCHFTDRPLPSSGVLPFMRGYICELNNSCSYVPRQSYYSENLLKLSSIGSDFLGFANQPSVISNSANVLKFVQLVFQNRAKADQITSNLTLSQVLLKNSNDFINQTTYSFNLSPTPLNSTILNLILNSNPNFNYLYSNYSKTYTEPFFILKATVPQTIINILYGSNLELIDVNRNTNQVDDPDWIRNQMCLNNTNYLLKGTNSVLLSSILCELNDIQLTTLFIFISSQINFESVKTRVYDSVYGFSFQLQAISAFRSILAIQQSFQDSSVLANNNIASLNQMLQTFLSMNVSQAICPDSQLSIFSFFMAYNRVSTSTNNINEFTSAINTSTNMTFVASSAKKLFQTTLLSENNNFESTEHRNRVRKIKKPKSNQIKNKIDESQQTNEQSNPRVSASSADSNNYDAITDLLTQLNYLNKLNASQCPVQRFNDSLDEADIYTRNSTTKSCFCQTLYSILDNLSGGSATLFGRIKPMFLGKILYAPNLPVYQSLIQRVNATFSNFGQLSDLIFNIAELTDQLNQQINSSTLDNIQSLLTNLQLIANQTDILNQMNINLNNLNNINLNSSVGYLRLTTQVLYAFHNLIGCVELNKFIGFPTEDQAVNVGLQLIDKESFWAAIIFQNNSQAQTPPDQFTLPKIVNYKIRMNSSQVHDTSYTQDRFYNYGPRNCLGCNSYFLYGFIYIQDMLEKAIIEAKTNQVQDFGIITQMTPYPCYVDDKFVTAIARSLPLFMVLAWIYSVSMMVKDIVYEKEKKLKEFMRVMGLSNATHWAAWFITSFVIMILVVILLCLILKYGKITTFTDFSVLLVFLCCFTIATITQCFLISVFFNKANLAAVVAGIIYFLLYLPYTILINYSSVILPWQKFLACLSSTVAFGYGCQIIATYELQNTGVTWNNFYISPFTTNDAYTMNTICLQMLFDALLHMLLTWYIEGVAPGEFGIPKPFYFPFSPTYWCGKSVKCIKKKKIDTEKNKTKGKSIIPKFFENIFFDMKEKQILEEEERQEKYSKNQRDSSIEILDENSLNPGIEINKMHKVYSRGNNHALKGLTVNFYENEISAFLGHNGAGKSTTMHLLTGLYTPTSGDAKINGLSITESMDKIRKSLGFVPQHNVLFPGLTVKEHLWFYARLKGLDRTSTFIEMNKLLEDTGLEPKENDFSKDLSGGMQRKLSVAIAFVGGSKTVILDEPSAGVDPSGRRSIWDLLFKYRLGRTIVISTHHMDEADVLGDRISIISNGKLIAHGTAYFLKNKFGRGYYLTLAKKKIDSDEFKTVSIVSEESNLSSKDQKEKSLSNESDSNLSPTQEKLLPVIGETETKEDDQNLGDIDENQKRKEISALNSLVKPQDIKIHDFIKNKIQNAILVENIGTEMTYSISNKIEFTKNYEKFFKQLELNMENLGIDSIGISDTTLEEIFIKLAKEPKKNTFVQTNQKILGFNYSAFKEKLDKCKNKKNIDLDELTEEQLNTYSSYTKLRVPNAFTWVIQQLKALLIKRFHRVKRNKKGFFAEIVLPVIFICLALLVATLTPSITDRPALELHPWYYQTPNNIFLSKSSSLNFDTPYYIVQNNSFINKINTTVQSNINAVNMIADTIYKSPGIGTRCMKNYKIVITKQVQELSRSSGYSTLDCNNFDYSVKQNYTLPTSDIVDQLNLANYSYSKLSVDCDCTNGFPNCPSSAGGDINFRDVVDLKTKDILFDLTSRNITDWLIKTEFDQQFLKKRYGGFEFLEPYSSFNNTIAVNLFQNIQTFLQSISNLIVQSQINSTISPTMINVSSINFAGSNPLITNQNFKIWYNLKGYIAPVSYLNAINNVLLRSKIVQINQAKNLDNSSLNYIDPEEHGIVAFNHPMKFTKAQFLDQLENQILIDLFVSICIIFALSFIPASFLVFLLEERENHSKQLQFVSGVKPYIYWISNFIWDLFNFIVPCILCILIFVFFNVKTYMSPENFPCLICLMLLYGWACIPLCYPLNYVFSVPSTAFVVSSTLNVFVGVITTMTTTVLDQLGDDDPQLLQINKILKPIFICLFPHYCLGQGFLTMSVLYNTAMVKRGFGLQVTFDPFTFDNNGRNLLAMTVQGFFYFTLNLLIEYKFFIRFKPTNDLSKLKLPPQNEKEDDDVANEKARILKNETLKPKGNKKFNFIRSKLDKIKINNEDIDNNLDNINDTRNIRTKYLKEDQTKEDFIKLVNLTKIYKKFKKFRFRRHVAVNALSVGINKGECFGLIGVNGAGKTTTFKMITGDISITGGDVYVNGYSVSKDIEKVHRNIGYCPQFDAIMPLLTAREHLLFFARLRGIPEKYIDKVSDWAMHRVGLNVFADRISGDFSGGNKRKLSTAIALVGDPSVICLDEPTSGMDAKARRLLWNDILSLIRENRIVILTSHSMEECEALCTRLVIMVNGQFKCLGSPQHLKAKFGNGYKLAIRLNDENDKDLLFKFMRETFPSSIIQETHKNLFEYILPFSSNKLSKIFGQIEPNRETLNIKDYSVSQTTLDQIFVNFAKAQNDEAFIDMDTLPVKQELNLMIDNRESKDSSLSFDLPAKNSEEPMDISEHSDKENVQSKISSSSLNSFKSFNSSKRSKSKMSIDEKNKEYVYFIDSNNNIETIKNKEKLNIDPIPFENEMESITHL